MRCDLANEWNRMDTKPIAPDLRCRVRAVILHNETTETTSNDNGAEKKNGMRANALTQTQTQMKCTMESWENIVMHPLKLSFQWFYFYFYLSFRFSLLAASSPCIYISMEMQPYIYKCAACTPTTILFPFQLNFGRLHFAAMEKR